MTTTDIYRANFNTTLNPSVIFPVMPAVGQRLFFVSGGYKSLYDYYAKFVFCFLILVKKIMFKKINCFFQLFLLTEFWVLSRLLFNMRYYDDKIARRGDRLDMMMMRKGSDSQFYFHDHNYTMLWHIFFLWVFVCLDDNLGIFFSRISFIFGRMV